MVESNSFYPVFDYFMKDADPIKQRNIDIAESLYRRFKAECSRRGMSLRNGFADALESWLSRGGVTAENSQPNASTLMRVEDCKTEAIAKNSEALDNIPRPEVIAVLLQMTEFILNSDHPAAVALGWNISTFSYAVQVWNSEQSIKHGSESAQNSSIIPLPPATESEREALRDHILQSARSVLDKARQLQSGGGGVNESPPGGSGPVRDKRSA
jgi:hypothetical protein